MLTRSREQEFNRLIEERIKLFKSHAEDSAVKEATQDIRRQCHAAGLGIDRVVTAGSHKKRTAVNINCDVDLAVFFRCDFEDYKSASYRKQQLIELAAYLQSTLDCDILRISHFLITLIYNDIKFDVVSAFDATEFCSNPVEQQRINMRNLVVNERNKLAFSASFTESAFKFVLERNEASGQRVLRCIKLAKLWNETYFGRKKNHSKRLRSYALELLICSIYDHNPEASTGNLFLTMLALLANPSNRTIYFTDYYKFRPSRASKHLRVFDPCFPELDVVDDFREWDYLAAVAQSTLDYIAAGTPIANIFGA